MDGIKGPIIIWKKVEPITNNMNNNTKINIEKKRTQAYECSS